MLDLLAPGMVCFREQPVIKGPVGDVLIPSALSINQPFLVHVCVLRVLRHEFHFGTAGREAGRANREQLHPDAIPLGSCSSTLGGAALWLILMHCILHVCTVGRC